MDDDRTIRFQVASKPERDHAYVDVFVGSRWVADVAYVEPVESLPSRDVEVELPGPGVMEEAILRCVDLDLFLEAVTRAREILDGGWPRPAGASEHDRLLQLVRYLPSDFEPYGRRERVEGAFDCSVGCRWYRRLEGELSHDWGVCANPRSPRCGLLTFEHQGCAQFEADDEDPDPTEPVR
jgi:hypothetical protein